MHELGRISPEEFREADKFPVILVLDNIRSGLNVGSIFRSADAFRIREVICCGYTPQPPHREVLKTALGACDTVAWRHAESTLEAVNGLKEQGCYCLAVEQTSSSVSLRDFRPDPSVVYALVLGNEVHGVDQEVVNACQGSLEIDQHGTKHSLNVAVCAGICLFAITGG